MNRLSDGFIGIQLELVERFVALDLGSWAELDEVLARVRADTPGLRRVIGGSWLYSLPSYAGLFPAAHLAGARVRRGRDRFNGMSHWGQLVDHRGDLSPARASAFRTRLAAWTGGDVCDVFPTPTLDLDSPIGVFDG